MSMHRGAKHPGHLYLAKKKRKRKQIPEEARLHSNHSSLRRLGLPDYTSPPVPGERLLLPTYDGTSCHHGVLNISQTATSRVLCTPRVNKLQHPLLQRRSPCKASFSVLREHVRCIHPRLGRYSGPVVTWNGRGPVAETSGACN